MYYKKERALYFYIDRNFIFRPRVKIGFEHSKTPTHLVLWSFSRRFNLVTHVQLVLKFKCVDLQVQISKYLQVAGLDDKLPDPFPPLCLMKVRHKNYMKKHDV
jgi:hypothetical protein